MGEKFYAGILFDDAMGLTGLPIIINKIIEEYYNFDCYQYKRCMAQFVEKTCIIRHLLDNAEQSLINNCKYDSYTMSKYMYRGKLKKLLDWMIRQKKKIN